MAQTAWPFENIDTTETQFSQWARNIGEGVIVGKGLELAPVGDSSGMNIKVKTGQALVRGHFYDNSAQETVTIATANVSNPRIDVVVLRLNPTANTITLTVITGTAAASPTAPSITQTDSGLYDLRIASVYVPAAATTISPSNVTDLRTFFTPNSSGLDGSRITGAITNATMNASLQVVTLQSKTANYSTAATDANSVIRLTGSTGRTFTITNTLTAGQRIDFVQDGSGQITFAAGSGVTLNSADGNLKTSKQYAGATVLCAGSGVYYLIGDLGA